MFRFEWTYKHTLLHTNKHKRRNSYITGGEMQWKYCISLMLRICSNLRKVEENKLYWLIRIKLTQGNFISPSRLMRAYYLSSQHSWYFSLFQIYISFFIADARYDSYAARRQTDQQESRLLSHLMENYDKEVRPVINASKAVEVRVGITLTQIFDMVSENTRHLNNERLNLLNYIKYYISISLSLDDLTLSLVRT